MTPRVIGLTGGIGSGKSSILQLFKEKGVKVYIADTEAKILMESDQNLIKKIIKAFGPAAYKNKKLDSIYLANIVFKNPDKLKVLNNIVHPAVKKHFIEYLETLNDPIIIFENAILFENGFDKLCDFIITVYAPKDLRMERVIKRDGTEKSRISERMQYQWDDEKKIALSHFSIENIDWKKTIKKVNEIYKKLIEVTKV